METGPWLKVSFDRLVKPGIEPATPGLQGKRFIYYTTAAPHRKCYKAHKLSPINSFKGNNSKGHHGKATILASDMLYMPTEYYQKISKGM